MKIAVLGAGASGLAAIKCCLDEGQEPVCFERTRYIGGLWRYTDEVIDGQSCVMKTTIINTSKEMMCYSDFPIPDDYPVFMHNSYVQKYFHLFADKFNLKQYINFETEIESVRQHPDYKSNGQWLVRTRDRKTDEVTEGAFDGVLVCTGHHAEKHIPEFPGLSGFKGEVLHSHDYRHSAGFENKRVVIIGIGNSGGDMAVELSRTASQVFLSTRRGSWVMNRIGQKGMPVDMLITRRFAMKLRDLFPYLAGKFMEGLLNNRFDHSLYGLKPQHGFFAQHPMLNDDMPNRLASGTLKIRPNVERFSENGVLFEDGTKEENIDVVVLATGYNFGFPFLDKSVLDVKHNQVELYKYVFPPKLEKQTLAVIGCIQPLGAIMPISELQCRLATRVFKGEVSLPDSSDMLDDINKKQRDMKERYVQTQRHTIQVDFIQYMDELAELNGTLPNLSSLVWEDPKLAFVCMFGPCTPYQYRISGPGKWSGARKAIMTQWDRTIGAFRTRPMDVKNKSEAKTIFMYFIIFVVIYLVIKMIVY